MSLSQVKIDLAVLYKLHQHAETDGGALRPADILRLFNWSISTRRVELALEALSAQGDVEREYHEHFYEEGLWQISRDGMTKVDRALRVPVSFIARLHANGDIWLDSDDAQQAVLKKLEPAQPAVEMAAISQLNALASAEPVGVDWTKWGTILGALGIGVSVLLWWMS